MNPMRYFSVISGIILLTCTPILTAARPDALTTEDDPYKLAGNLRAYPYVEVAPPPQTPAPQGYVPFHMEHYGRHGSRWLIGKNDYITPMLNLEKAEKHGLLTSLGKKTLEAVRNIQKASVGRLGELSEKGAIQHQAIGRRMAQNFPEIFNADADIDAKSTVVIRCILSMLNSLTGIKEVVPDVHYTTDASSADMWFMNYNDKDAYEIKVEAKKTALKQFNDNIDWSDSYLDRLVTDSKFARDSVKPDLMPRFFWILANTQSHTDQPWLLDQIFTTEEMQQWWASDNADWFINGGNTDVTGGRIPYVQRNLLGMIIAQTDSAIQSPKPSARLRYGHDSIVLPLVSLLELGDYGKCLKSLDDIAPSNWRNYDIVPMGANIQLIFYRKPGDTAGKDILVKAMLNEQEIALPGTPVTGPYYDWNQIRKYYETKLADFNKKYAHVTVQ